MTVIAVLLAFVFGLVVGALLWSRPSWRPLEPHIEPRPDGFVVEVAKFGLLLGGRYRADGKFSGEFFREDVLLPALAENDRVVVDFSDVLGPPAAWLNEVFAHDAVRAMADRIEIYTTDHRMWGFMRYAELCLHGDKYTYA